VTTEWLRLLPTSTGKLYGTTQNGGSYGYGPVYTVTVHRLSFRSSHPNTGVNGPISNAVDLSFGVSHHDQGFGGPAFCAFGVSAGAAFEFVSADALAPAALAGADDVEPPVVVTGGAEFCSPAPLAPPPIGLEIAEAGVIPVVPIGLEMAEAGVMPEVPSGFEAGVIPGMGAPVVCGPMTLVSPGKGVFVAVGPVMVTPGMFVFPAVPFTAPGVVKSAEPDVGTALVGVP